MSSTFRGVAVAEGGWGRVFGGGPHQARTGAKPYATEALADREKSSEETEPTRCRSCCRASARYRQCSMPPQGGGSRPDDVGRNREEDYPRCCG